MSDDKTRPTDNLHCFRGAGLVYWGAKARGLQPHHETKRGRDGHRFDYVNDDDGFAMNNGGIQHPEMRMISQRKLIRFFAGNGTVEKALKGNWWMDFDALNVMINWALNADMPLSKAVGMLLVVPTQWGDCRQFLVATPKVDLKAYIGLGKPVSLTTSGKDASPDAARRPGSSVFAAPPGTNLEQIFLPGDPDLLERCLVLNQAFRIAQDGSIEPPIHVQVRQR